MADTEELKAKLQARLEAPDMLGRLADEVGASMKASAVFGQPIERGGVTVIPVAKAAWGFGGGSGGDEGSEGSGGGGGGVVSPEGYIEVRESGAEFKRIRETRLLVAGVAAAVGLAGLALGRLSAGRRSV